MKRGRPQLVIYQPVEKLEEGEFGRVMGIGISIWGIDYSVNRVELDHIRKTENIYYLNYKVYGMQTLHYGNLEDGTYSMEEECNIWAYAVLETMDNWLEYKGIFFGKRSDRTNSELAAYSGQ